jgi:signal transduction histidine kinase
MGIRNKLILVYGLLFIAAVGVMGTVVTRYISEAVESQYAAQAENAARLFSRFNQGPAWVANAVRGVYGIDGAVLEGRRWESTLESPAQAVVEEAHREGRLDPREGSARIVPLRLAEGRETVAVCVSYRSRASSDLGEPQAPAPAGILILIYPADQVASEIARARRPFTAVVVVGLLLVAVLGVWIAHTITRPLERLAGRAREVGAGHLEATAAGVPAPGASGTPAGDGTDRKRGDEIAQLSGAFDRMVEGLRRYQENLLRSEKLAVAGRMAAGIAHEIRNPLAAMRMTVQLLSREEPDGERRQSLDLLLAEIGRIEEAVGELMDLANPAPPRREPTDLNAVVEDVLALVQPQASHQGIGIERRLADLPRLEADRRRLRRVVMNLVLNALQAMPARGRLTVGTMSLPGGAGASPKAVRLTVTDTGPGIPPELRDRIFDPFTTGKVAGTGLGLAVTKRIVEEHGGSIGFETGDPGTTFWVELP